MTELALGANTKAPVERLKWKTNGMSQELHIVICRLYFFKINTFNLGIGPACVCSIALNMHICDRY